MTTKIPSERLTLGGIFKREAKKLGIQLVLEPEWGVVGQLTTKKGARRYFKTMSLDLNTQGAAAVSSDKDYAAYFLKKMGYPMPEGEAFHSDEWRTQIDSKRDWRSARAYAKKLGYPVIVKPNSKSQGKGVVLANNASELADALKEIFTYDRIALVQKQIVGHDYRIVILDGVVISSYERIPLSVTGDGRSTILELLKKRQAEFKRIGRDTKINVKDPRIRANIAKQGVPLLTTHKQGDALLTVPQKAQRVQLLDNANLSSGGDAIDVTEIMHAGWKKLSAKIARDMNLRFTGVDLIIPGDIAKPPDDYCILEVNDSPGLDNYATIGPAQKKIVENLYRSVLVAMVSG